MKNKYIQMVESRNYNDQSNYPIFLCVLRYSESSVLYLNDHTIYTNFSLLNDEKLTHIFSDFF